MLDATPLLRLYAKRRLATLAAENPVDTQQKQLLKLVRHAQSTRFGREHGFAAIRTIAEFQQRVPLRRYEDFWTGYWQAAYPVVENVTWPGRIPYWANSSGTTSGATKHIPVSHQMVSANRRAAIELLVHHIANRPESRVLGGLNFMLGGSMALSRVAPGVAAGDLSGIAAAEVPWWARRRYFPPPELALIADWEEKVAQLSARSLTEDIRTVGGTPSWLLLFFQKLNDLKPEGTGRLVEYYPRLELLVHGGVNFAPYRRQFEALLESSRAEMREVYPASEGFVAIADCGPGEGLRLLLDNGLFFEFVPVNELHAAEPTRHWIADVETGVDYAVIVTSCAGLWAYVLGDTVRFVDRAPPRVLVTGRTSYGLSAFGEHLIGEEIEQAVAAAAADIDASVTDFSVGPVHPAHPDTAGFHRYVVEFSSAVEQRALSRFAQRLDEELTRLNLDYAEHRRGDFGMRAPEVLAVSSGTFAGWMKSRGKLGGQNKVPRVILDTDLFASLVGAAEPMAKAGGHGGPPH